MYHNFNISSQRVGAFVAADTVSITPTATWLVELIFPPAEHKTAHIKTWRANCSLLDFPRSTNQWSRQKKKQVHRKHATAAWINKNGKMP
jgi:hypothetical protein